MGHYLERKESITTTNAFPKILDESNLKKDEISIDKGSKSYIRSMKSWLCIQHILKENLLLLKGLLEA